jgi:hypothetical protein
MFSKTLGWETIPMMDFKSEFWKMRRMNVEELEASGF